MRSMMRAALTTRAPVGAILGVALALTAIGALAGVGLLNVPGAHATARNASKGPFLTLHRPLPTPLEQPSRARRTVSVTATFRLDDARLVRVRGRRAPCGHAARRCMDLRGRPVGRGRIRMQVRRGGHVSVHREALVHARAPALAAALDGLAGRGTRLHARLAGRHVRLWAPHVHPGRLAFHIAGLGRRGRRLGRTLLVVHLDRQAELRAGCVIVPFAACPRVGMDLGDLLLADLRGADLRRARMQRVFANSADLSAADLRESDLRGADLTNADLRDADLRRADLADATLKGAAIAGARLRGAYLCRTLMPRHRRRTMRDCGKPAPRHRRMSEHVVRALPPEHDHGAELARIGLKRHRPVKINHRRLSRVKPGSPLGRALAGRRHKAKVHEHAFATRVARFHLRAAGPAAATTQPLGPASTTAASAPRAARCPYPPSRDSDGDGLTDCWEITPHTVHVVSALDLNQGNPQGHTETYTTDPKKKDTDGDGLSDLQEERTVASNPAVADSDGDGLSDGQEWNVYVSSPINADTDGDSKPAGQPRSRFLYDGAEAKMGSSPVAADSDGDGLSDYSEITDGDADTNPIVANLPSFTVGPDQGTNVQINVPTEVTVGNKTSAETESSTMKTQESSESHEFSVKLGLEFSQEFEQQDEVGEPSNEASFKATYGFKESISTGTTNTWESTSSSEEEYRKLQSEEQSKDVTTKPTGCVGAVIDIHNTSSTRGFELDNGTQILAEVPDATASPADPRANVLATMLPVAGEPYSGECPGNDPNTKISLGPGESKRVSFSGPGDSKDLIAYLGNPTPITFVSGNYNITNLDNTTQPFSTTEANVNKRDSAVAIDYGDAKSGAGRVAQYQVFTGLKLQPGTSSVAGAPMGTMLTALGLHPSYGGGKDGRAKLTGLGGVANAAKPNDGLWTALGSANGIGDQSVDFPGMTLVPGEGSNIVLTYLDDGDNDGVPDNTEGFNGTSPTSKDTDGDGLSDKFETEVGWLVALSHGPDPGYHVYSSPISCDADGDGSPDGPGPGNKTYGMCPKGPPEYERATAVGSAPSDLHFGTDPKQADTNLDGVTDGQQSYPQVLEYVPPNARAPRWIGTFGGKGNGGGKFEQAQALSVDPDGSSVMVDDPPAQVVQKMMLTNLDPKNPDYASQVGPFYRLTPGWWPRGAVVSPLTTTAGSPHGSTKGNVLWLGHVTGGHVTVHQYNSATLSDTDHSFKGCSFGRGGGINQDAVTASMDTDHAGNVYLATAQDDKSRDASDRLFHDREVACVAEYRPDGGKVRDFGYAYGETSPSSMRADITNPTGIAVAPNGNVFAIDNVPGVREGVREFDAQSGRPMPGFASKKLDDPSGIGVDGNGFVYVLDRNHGLVYKFSSNLTYLNTFGGEGTGRGKFTGPVDVDADPGEPAGKWDGNLYILDQPTGRIEVFDYPHGEEPPAPGGS